MRSWVKPEPPGLNDNRPAEEVRAGRDDALDPACLQFGKVRIKHSISAAVAPCGRDGWLSADNWFDRLIRSKAVCALANSSIAREGPRHKCADDCPWRNVSVSSAGSRAPMWRLMRTKSFSHSRGSGVCRPAALAPVARLLLESVSFLLEQLRTRAILDGGLVLARILSGAIWLFVFPLGRP
jgi:hypothetical protein